MGINCKPTGEFKKVMKRLEYELKKEEEEKKKEEEEKKKKRNELKNEMKRVYKKKIRESEILELLDYDTLPKAG